MANPIVSSPGFALANVIASRSVQVPVPVVAQPGEWSSVARIVDHDGRGAPDRGAKTEQQREPAPKSDVVSLEH